MKIKEWKSFHKVHHRGWLVRYLLLSPPGGKRSESGEGNCGESLCQQLGLVFWARPGRRAGLQQRKGTLWCQAMAWGNSEIMCRDWECQESKSLLQRQFSCLFVGGKCARLRIYNVAGHWDKNTKAFSETIQLTRAGALWNVVGIEKPCGF